MPHQQRYAPARQNPLWRSGVLLSLVVLLLGCAGKTIERGSAAQAQDMVNQAIRLFDERGAQAAFRAIENGSDGLRDGDLYVFVYGPERTIVAHGSNRLMRGTQADSLIDQQGVPFGALFMDRATPAGVWVDYQWWDPATNTVQPKSSWVVRHQGYVFGCGIYLDQ